jgi:hypothetical protein
MRCIRCGAIASEWAAHCPNCDGDLYDATYVELQPAPPAGRRPAPEHRRQPSPARPIALALAAFLVAAPILAATFARAGPTARPGEGAAGLTGAFGLDAYGVVYTGASGVQVVNLSGRDATTAFRGAAGPALPTASGVAFVHAGGAYLLAPPFQGEARLLAPAERLFPMLWPGTIGVEWRVAWGPVEASYVDLEGEIPALTSEWALPVGYQAVGQFVALGPGGELREWEPGPDGRATLGAVIGRSAGFVSSDGVAAVWLSAAGCNDNGECPLLISEVGAGTPVAGRRVTPPAGHHGFLPGGGLSPDGALLATFVTGPDGRADEAQLVIVDTTTLTATPVPAAIVQTGAGSATAHWSPDGDAVLFSGPGGMMNLYSTDTGRSAPLGIPGAATFAVVSLAG